MKCNELIGKTVTEVRPMTAAELTKAAFGDNYVGGVVMVLSDGRRFFTPGIVSEDHGALTDAPALPEIPDAV